MAILKDLLVNGTSRFVGNVTGANITATSFIKSGGTSSQFLKADGSVDSNTYATSSSLGSYLPLTGGTLTGSLTVPINASVATDTTKGLNFSDKAHLGYSTGLGIYSLGEIWIRPAQSSLSSADSTKGLKITGTTFTYNNTNVSLEGHKHAYTDLTGSGTTADQAIVSSGTANGWTLKTLGSNAFTSTSYLPLDGGTMSNTTVVTNLNADLLDGVHISGINPKVIYNATNGVLIKTDLPSASSRMVYVEITGNSYGDGNKLPIHTIINFYDYTSTGGIIGNPSAINLSNQGIQSINLFRYDGKVCIWFAKTGSYMTYYVIVRTQGDSMNHAGTLSNSAMPESGVEFLTTITPKQNIIESDELTTTEINTICV